MKFVFESIESQRRAAGPFVAALAWIAVPLIATESLKNDGGVVGAVIAACIFAQVATISSVFFGMTAIGRSLSGVALMAEISLLVSGGGEWQMDLHMVYFAALALLIAYADRAVILSAAAAVVANLLVLNFAAPSAVFLNAGGLDRVLLHALILITEAGTLIWVIGNLDNIFAISATSLALVQKQHGLLQEQEEKLHAQYVRLHAALNNIVQGVSMFDAEQKLVLCNARYLQIYNLASTQVKPGMSLQEINRLRVNNGTLNEKAAAAIFDKITNAGNGVDQLHCYLKHDRCIAITTQLMSDGGVVTTHQDITDQRRSEAKIAHLALHDVLTGLPNRALLNEQLENALARVNRGEVVAVHILDLDDFKTVNDTLGHPMGDRLLKIVADRLRAQVREIDTIARMGGDEFAIIESLISGPEDAALLARRIIEAVNQPYELDDHQVVIGTSIGIAIGPHNGTTPDELMRNADLALYCAKGKGRGSFHFFEPAMDAQMQARATAERELRSALANKEFDLDYQPIFNLASDTISGFEALLRWRHPEKGVIQPDKFIPLAEATRLIVPIGEWVIRTACATAAKWPAPLGIAVNLSVAQFGSQALVEVVVDALMTSGLAPHRLELEITESLLLEGDESTLAMLHQLRDLGVRIAMDDFGAGYSSLGYLQSFPFDKIKIDKSFVKGIASHRSSSLNIIRAVAALANGLGIVTTAEGVETDAQLEAVRAEGCTEMQGFLRSRPLHAADVDLLLLSLPAGEKRNDAHIAA
jgi:diguanylate cyclase (GGDEF)-like protein